MNMRTPARLMTLPHDAPWPAPVPIAPWCEIRPTQWWDTGDLGNAKAIALCRACPFRTCLSDVKPAGVIQDGVAYNRRGRELAECPQCGHPMDCPETGGAVQCAPCGRRVGDCAPHHDLIVEMLSRDPRPSYPEVAKAIGANPETLRSYWRRYKQGITKRKPESSLLNVS